MKKLNKILKSTIIWDATLSIILYSMYVTRRDAKKKRSENVHFIFQFKFEIIKKNSTENIFINTLVL